VVAEDERAAIVVRDRSGQDHGSYEAMRRPRDGALTVPLELTRRLESCEHVGVMAQSMLQGQPRILPASLPGSYVTGARRPGAAGTRSPTRALIVENVTPPANLSLPALSPEPPDRVAQTIWLSGPDATPERVLDEMRDATEIEFHTHVLIDAGISDAAYIVLSRGQDGFALTAEAIHRAELRGQPIVVLVACNSGQGAKYQHTSWSLPDAFLAVGARAVLATGTEVPDGASKVFFHRVLDRIRSGIAPAQALRDERMAILKSEPSSWVADVMLFE
jgi:hypothetical protein